MSLKKYIAEAEHRQHHPDVGDTFAIELEDGTLLETYILAIKENSILLDATDKIVSVLNEWHYIGDRAGEVLLENSYEPEEQHSVSDDSGDVEVADQDSGEYDYEGDMAKDELATMIRAARRLTGMLDDNENMPEWVQKKISKAADYVDTAADYIESNKQGMAEGMLDNPGQEDSPVAQAIIRRILLQRTDLLAKYGPERVGSAVDEVADFVGDVEEIGSSDVSGWVKHVEQMLGNMMDEAKYQGREVALGKPMRGDVAKFKVYVRDPSTGNIKKVNFGHGGTSAKRAGQKTMKIKKSDPARRRSFRARHNCDNPGPRTKARYWSCRAW